ncbi:hypothetical protein [Streptomyces sp. NPDC037389]|uniref:hypothetical protein n=1 Tax=Streptomyces sp. NPDC037389 TaxID=3155369 RepID=UPI0033FB6115
MLTSTVCAAVSAAGLGIALVTAYRKRFRAAIRLAAWSLIPVGLVMTGVVDWLTGLVLKPTVWAGFGVLALSALLFLAGRAADRRADRRAGRRGGGRKERKATAGAPGRDVVAPAASAPSLGSARRGKPASGDEDFSDIEAILKKHGI